MFFSTVHAIVLHFNQSILMGKERKNSMVKEDLISMQKFWNKGIKCSKQIKALKEEYGKENGRV
jgi:HD-like signal output (HDOD) protein